MKIAIVGYGVEGKASFTYWNTPENQLTIVDERKTLADVPENAQTILGPDALEQLDDFDLVIRTASLRPDKLHTNGKQWSATNEFFATCPAPIIGVTGTKGKGTTASLIASILRAAGKTVHLVGNIGVPALQVLQDITPDDIVVYELSSFQLWDLEKSPHIAVVLMIEADHLDIHVDFDEYLQAKMNIARHQQPNDEIVYRRGDKWSRAIAEPSPATTRTEYPHGVSDDLLDVLVIPGEHNRENACAAVAAVQSYVTDGEVIKRGLAAFAGLPHRLKFVAEKNGARYYDDSISTTPGSALAAVRSFPNVHKVLILGGSDKGASYADLINEIRNEDVSVLAIGQMGSVIADLCAEYGVPYMREEGMMHNVVHCADEMAHVGDVVLLSPASASFDQYENYSDRGDKFIAAVLAL